MATAERKARALRPAEFDRHSAFHGGASRRHQKKIQDAIDIRDKDKPKVEQ